MVADIARGQDPRAGVHHVVDPALVIVGLRLVARRTHALMRRFDLALALELVAASLFFRAPQRLVLRRHHVGPGLPAAQYRRLLGRDRLRRNDRKTARTRSHRGMLMAAARHLTLLVAQVATTYNLFGCWIVVSLQRIDGYHSSLAARATDVDNCSGLARLLL